MEREKLKSQIYIDKKDLLCLLLFIAIFLSMFSSFFFERNTFYERDSTLLETPFRMHAIQLLKEGYFALWTDSHGNGQPFLANPKMAIFYPTTWAYLIFPFFVAFKIHYLIHPIIGWFGMFLLGKSYGLSRKAAFFSSSLFFLSGMYLSSFEFYNHIAAIAWVMWILLFQRLNFRLWSAGFFFYVLFWLLLILSGAPEFIIIAGILSVAQAFFEPGGQKKELFHLGIALLLAIFLAAAQIIPSIELLSKTERNEGFRMWQLELVQIPELIFPKFLGDDRKPGHDEFWGSHFFSTWYPLYYSIYIGFGAFLLFLLGLLRLNDRKYKIIGGLAAIFFLISSGRYFFFFPILERIPFISSIRFPVKYFMGCLFCLVILAGRAFDRLKNELPGKTFSLAASITATISIILFAIFHSQIINSLCRWFVIQKESSKALLSNSILFGLISFCFYSFIFLAIRKFKFFKEGFSIILLLAGLFEPAYHNKYINPTISQSFFKKPDLLNVISTPAVVCRDTFLPFTPGMDDISRIRLMSFYRNSLFPYSGIPYSVRYVLNDDFMASYSRYQRDLQKKISKLPLDKKRKILKYLGCQYYIISNPLFIPEKSQSYLIEGFPVYVEKISEGNDGVPRIIKMIIIKNSDEELLNTFVHPDFDPENMVILKRSSGLYETLKKYGIKSDTEVEKISDLTEQLQGKIEVIKSINGQGKYFIRLKEPSVIVFPGNFANGWKAWIDGKRVPVFQANLFSKAVVVPGGDHEVILKYLPDSFLAGCLISIISMVTIISLYICIRLKNRKEKLFLS